MIDLDNIVGAEFHIISEEDAWERENQIALDTQHYREHPAPKVKS